MRRVAEEGAGRHGCVFAGTLASSPTAWNTLGTMSDSPLDQLLDQLRAALHTRRADVLRRIDEVERALAVYRASAEQRVALDFAIAHGFRRPDPAPLTPRQAAERLLSLVQSLPELGDESGPSSSKAGPSSARSASAETGGEAELEGRATVSTRGSTAPSTPDGAALATLTAHGVGRKLVVIGALAGRRKDGVLPPPLEERTEWVDTERDGVHAIGNLPQRIRQNRVGAVVILDRAVQHKHTEPIVAAARDTNTPIAFAGKGGNASLLRAVEQLDKRLEASR
jgi:hypothetical protein